MVSDDQTIEGIPPNTVQACLCNDFFTAATSENEFLTEIYGGGGVEYLYLMTITQRQLDIQCLMYVWHNLRLRQCFAQTMSPHVAES